MISDKGRDFWRPLGFIIDCSMNVHVAVEDGEKLVFPLQERGGQDTSTAVKSLGGKQY